MPESSEKNPPEKGIGGFFQRYATLLSSTVLGIAGIAATSMWQCRQSAIGEQQAASQQQVAQVQAENSWKIERADILSKNIGVLASSGPTTAEQRYGVLLSLTRGNLLDPELALSYALELGKDNPDDMQSVLSTIPTKDYSRIARAFTLSCDAKYGISPQLPICDDKLAPRSEALAKLIADDGELALTGTQPGPLVLLKDERPVQQHVQRMVALFQPLLAGLYEERRWDAIEKFTAYSPAAHLVAAIVLTAAHTGEFVTDAEQKQLEKLDASNAEWLAAYLVGPTCDAECKSRALGAMLSRFAESEGSYDAAARAVLSAPKAQSTMALTFVHTRLLWCQIEPNDLAALRDRVLVPLATSMLANPAIDPSQRDSVVGLVELVPDPPADDPAWKVLSSQMAAYKLGHWFDRAAQAQKQRANPPPKFKDQNFCAAPIQDAINALTNG